MKRLGVILSALVYAWVGPVCLATAQNEPPPEYEVLAPEVKRQERPQRPPGVFKAGDWHEIGPMEFHPSLSYQFIYGSGIRGGGGGRTVGRQETTILQTISPGINLTFYDLLNVSYSPSFTFYTNDAFEDEVDHNIDIGLTPGRVLEFGKWTVSFSQSFQTQSDTSAETGGQFDRITSDTGVNASYDHSSKTTVELGLSQSIRLAQNERLSDSYQWQSMNWLDYQMLPKTHLAAGIGGGYVMQEAGGRSRVRATDMTFEQFRARLRYLPTPKLSFGVNGGVEVRQFLDTETSDDVNPIFGLQGTYQPRPSTSISLSADRTVRSSFFGGQVRKVTSFRASFSQSFYRTYNWRVSASYETSTFEGIARQQTFAGQQLSGRDDERVSIQTSVGRSFLENGNVSVFYRFSENTTNRRGFGFQSNQVGFQIGYRF